MNFFRFFFLFLFCVFSVQEVYSYIDPGTGTYLIQLLIASFAALLYFVKVFWSQIKSFFVWLVVKVNPSRSVHPEERSVSKEGRADRRK